MKVAIIGFGYWGEILFKSVINLKKYINYVCVVDKDLEKEEKARGYKVDFFKDIASVFDKVDICLIATWENTHYEIAKECLLKGKHVFVEKPLSTSYKEAKELVRIARKNNLTLMVDNTFIFDKSFLLLKEKIGNGEIGKLRKVNSFRFSPNIIKPFTDVIVDLFPHDLSIFHSLSGNCFAKINKVSTHCLVNKECDNAEISLNYGPILTNSFLSWTYPVSRREMVFYGDEGILLWEKKDSKTDLLSHFKYERKNKATLKEQIEIEDKTDTLVSSLSHFFQSIIDQKEPITGGKNVLPEIKILENILARI